MIFQQKEKGGTSNRKKSFATLHRIRAGSPAELRDVLLAERCLGDEGDNFSKSTGKWLDKKKMVIIWKEIIEADVFV